jgi:membrane fusion protein (multidrug efflux system)
VALVFASAVIVGLIYMVNSAAYQSTDDAFIDGHIVPVSAQVAGRVQSVYVDDNQSVNKGDLIVELDPRDFDAAARQKAAALASSQAQAAAAWCFCLRNPSVRLFPETLLLRIKLG